MPKNYIDSGLQRTWLVDAPCWGLRPHFCGDGLLCREGTRALQITKKSLLIFQDIVFNKFHGLDFIFDNWGSPGWLLDVSWLNLVGAHDSHYCRVRRSKDIVVVFIFQDFIFSVHGIFHLQIWWHRSSVVCRKSYGRTLCSLWHLYSHPSTTNRCQQVGSDIVIKGNSKAVVVTLASLAKNQLGFWSQ